MAIKPPKTRTYVARPPKKQPTMPPPPVPSSSKPQRGKRKSKPTPEKGSTQNSRKKRKTKGKGRDRDQDDELSTCSDEDLEDDYNPSETRRSKRRAEPPTEEYQEVDEYGDLADDTIRASTTQTDDVDMADSTPSRDVPPSTMAFEFEITEEEEKPKPILQLKYQGFNIYGHCLCVVVEPWPQVRSMSRALSVATVLNREPRIAPPRSVAAREPGARAKTPLFLPDDYDRERSETPAPFRAQSVPEGSIFDPSFLEDSDDSDDNGGMMLFSQVLNNAGDARAGAADDDEDMDTDMFFGDADEMREL
ncbi:hypothetical protein C0991_012023 [Blastosporella zonata]|nr:hypothetical protein C0991_012023 [Blastosporella zonata]